MDLLGHTSTTPERVRGLQGLGLTPQQLAATLGVSSSGLRNWGNGHAAPRASAALLLDDLRAVARLLLDRGMEAERVAAWLTSRDPRTQERPVDAIAHRPTEVLASAAAATSS
jgi:hypothetical protein